MSPQSEARIRAAVAELGDAILAVLAEPEAADAPDRLYTVPETATALRVARSSVYSLISSGSLRSVRVGGRRLVPASFITEYLSRDSR